MTSNPVKFRRQLRGASQRRKEKLKNLLETLMFNPFIDAYFQYCKMAMDTATVLNYRLSMLQRMASDPAILLSPAKWFEINNMVSEKLLSFGQAYTLLAMNLAQLPYGKLPSAEKMLQLQRKTLYPVRKTLSANARRLKKKKN